MSLDPDSKFQTIRGWEATAYAGNPNLPSTVLDAVLDSAVAIGITRLRLEVRSGAEQPIDHWSLLQQGVIDDADFRCRRYATVNDNTDPRDIDWSGFHFSELDRQVERIVLPFAERLARRGQRLEINLNYVGFVNAVCEGEYIHADQPDEYAEFALATHIHLRDQFGIVPDSYEMVLEPDNGDAWTPAKLAAAVAATGQLLEANGFPARIVAPSTTSMGGGLDWVRAILDHPQARPFLWEISYHRYRATGQDVAAAYGLHAGDGIPTSMLEWIGATHETLLEDLSVAQVSTWQQFTLADGGEDRGSAYLRISEEGGGGYSVSEASRTRYLSPVFREVRPGAVRIGAEVTNDNHRAVAFESPNGTQVLVVAHRRSGTVQVTGLRPGEYRITRVTERGSSEAAEVVDGSMDLEVRGTGLMAIAGIPPRS